MPITITEVPASDILYTPAHLKVARGKAKGLVHYSIPINDLYYRVMKGYKDQSPEAQLAAVWEGGFTLEELLENAYAKREGERRKFLSGVARPKEITYQGFYMNPDGVRVKPAPKQNHEYKMTTRSASTLLSFDAEYPHWIWQSAGYSLAMGCEETVWWVLCIGRAQLYKTDPWKPARLFKVERGWQNGEREHHFAIVVRHCEVMKKNGMMLSEKERV